MLRSSLKLPSGTIHLSEMSIKTITMSRPHSKSSGAAETQGGGPQSAHPLIVVAVQILRDHYVGVRVAKVYDKQACVSEY